MSIDNLAEGNSNVLGMKRNQPRDLVAAKQVKKAWKTARGLKVRKDNEGNVLSRSMQPGPSLKAWARNESTGAGSNREVAEIWLKNKTSPQTKSNKSPQVKTKK